MNAKLLLLAIIVFGLGCTTDKLEIINLSDFKEYSMDKSQIKVTFLKSFNNKRSCDSSKNLFYADVVLCTVDDTHDTIMVLNICAELYDFLKNNYSGPTGLRINKSSVITNHPNQVLSNFDKSLLSKKYKYLIAEIRNYLDG